MELIDCILTTIFALSASAVAQATSTPITTISSIIYSVVTGSTSAGLPMQTGCPTVTLTSSICSSCAIPDCVELEPLTQSCGCPSAIPTVFLNFPCGSSCAGLGCAAKYVFFTAGCPSPTANSTTSSNSSTSATGTNSTAMSTGTGVGGWNSTATGITFTSSATRSVVMTGSTTAISSAASTAAAGRIRPFWIGWA